MKSDPNQEDERHSLSSKIETVQCKEKNKSKLLLCWFKQKTKTNVLDPWPNIK